MWLLNWAPDIAIHLMLVVGILGIIISQALKMVPVIDKYSLPLLVGGVLVSLLGVWYEGGIAKDKEYRKAIAEMKVKVAESERKAAEATGRVEIVYRDKVKVVTDTKVVIQEKIINMADYINAKCKVPPEAIDLINQAAKKPQGVSK